MKGVTTQENKTYHGICMKHALIVMENVAT